MKSASHCVVSRKIMLVFFSLHEIKSPWTLVIQLFKINYHLAYSNESRWLSFLFCFFDNVLPSITYLTHWSVLSSLPWDSHSLLLLPPPGTAISSGSGLACGIWPTDASETCFHSTRYDTFFYFCTSTC